MSKTIDEAAAALGISRQALNKWRRKARQDKACDMTPVAVYNPKTRRMVTAMTGAQLDAIRNMRKAAGQ